jgi:hypothetical protein
VKKRTAAVFELFERHIQLALAVTHSSAALIQRGVEALRKSGAVVSYAALDSLLTQVRSMRDADVSADDVQGGKFHITRFSFVIMGNLQPFNYSLI